MNTFLTSMFRGWHRSYTQVFFSDQPIFAGLLILVSFIDPNIGLSGLVCVTMTNLIAWILGYDRKNISEGVYGFNSLLVGFGLGANYEINAAMSVLLVFAAVLTLLITLWLYHRLITSFLPILSLPFLISFWILLLASRQYHALDLNPHGIYMPNELWKIGGINLLDLYEKIQAVEWPSLLIIYFHSLGAIIFQHELIAGIGIAIGLMIYSRIAFILSWIGFFSGWFFYSMVGGNQITDLEYGYIGFNFILSAIAVGGFFYVPSAGSYVLSSLIAPVNAILIAAFAGLILPYQLPLLSLPFNVSVLTVLFALQWRYVKSFFYPVLYQYFSPEKNLYHYLNRRFRFGKHTGVIFTLPFFGEWTVTQGHQGKITHQNQWRHAWDFEILDQDGKPHSSEGRAKEDYYCYGLPVIAPADGWIEEIIDFVDDNLIGEVNLKQNWGNTVIIRHSEGMYSKLCHLQPRTIKAKKHTYVKRGEVLGYCGNSGRSPRPHLHFQIQPTPSVGSHTIDMPVSYYLSSENGQYQLRNFEIPAENQKVCNVQTHPLLAAAYHFVPGSFINVSAAPGLGNDVIWEVKTDLYNQTFLYCKDSGSYAYFVNDDVMFYFVSFTGNKKSALYHFYLANYKVLLGFYSGMTLSDRFTLSDCPGKMRYWLHDLTAPFFQYQRFDYAHSHHSIDDPLRANEIILRSGAAMSFAGKEWRRNKYEIHIRNNFIEKMIIDTSQRKQLCVMFSPE